MRNDPLPHGGTIWRTDNGRLALWPPRAGILVAAMAGHGARAFAQPIAAAYDQIPRSSAVHLFFDFDALVDYDPPLRTELVLHFFPDRPRIRATHVLVKPQPQGSMMGAAINAFRGIVNIVEERKQFEALLDECLTTAGVQDFSSSALRAFVSTR